MTLWFTADHHFGHKNIIKFCNRPFSDVDEMDEMLIENWNSVVGKDDVVYYVGDFTLKGYAEAQQYFSRLNGYIYVIEGSHDRWIDDAQGRAMYSRQHQIIFRPPLYSLINKIATDTEPKHDLPVVLCHYAMRSWDRSHYGSWHLFGHHHGNLAPYGLSFDIGVDCWNFFPVSFEQVAEKMATLKPIVDYSKSRV